MLGAEMAVGRCVSVDGELAGSFPPPCGRMAELATSELPRRAHPTVTLPRLHVPYGPLAHIIHVLTSTDARDRSPVRDPDPYPPPAPAQGPAGRVVVMYAVPVALHRLGRAPVLVPPPAHTHARRLTNVRVCPRAIRGSQVEGPTLEVPHLEAQADRRGPERRPRNPLRPPRGSTRTRKYALHSCTLVTGADLAFPTRCFSSRPLPRLALCPSRRRLYARRLVSLDRARFDQQGVQAPCLTLEFYKLPTTRGGSDVPHTNFTPGFIIKGQITLSLFARSVRERPLTLAEQPLPFQTSRWTLRRTCSA